MDPNSTPAECTICDSEYDDNTHEPCIGTCGHTICETCKDTLKSSKCPYCNREQAFEAKIINFQLKEFMKANKFANMLKNMKENPNIFYCKVIGRIYSKKDTTDQILVLRADAIVCEICKEHYNEDARKPCVGSCGHAICEFCREDMISFDCQIQKCQEKDTFVVKRINYQVLGMLKALHFTPHKNGENETDVIYEVLSDEQKETAEKYRTEIKEFVNEFENVLESLRKYSEEGMKLSDEEKEKHENNVAKLKEEIQKVYDVTIYDVAEKLQMIWQDVKKRASYVAKNGKAFPMGNCSGCGEWKKRRISVNRGTENGSFESDGNQWKSSEVDVILKEDSWICADCILDGDPRRVQTNLEKNGFLRRFFSWLSPKRFYQLILRNLVRRIQGSEVNEVSNNEPGGSE